MRNVEAAAVYDKVVINTQTVLDALVLLHWLIQASFIVWEATDDGLFKGLVLLIVCSMSSEFVEVQTLDILLE